MNAALRPASTTAPRGPTTSRRDPTTSPRDPTTARRRTRTSPRGATVIQDGRAKAYRPLPAAVRADALRAGIAAYERGDFFAAHELLEPAWMGTDDIGERELYQGLIKLAAAYVHGVRGNPTGIERNLRGARARLASAVAAGGLDGGLDLPRLVADIDARLAAGGLLGTPGVAAPSRSTRRAGALAADEPPILHRRAG